VWLAAALLAAWGSGMGVLAAGQVPLPALAHQRLQLTDVEMPEGFVGLPFHSSVMASGGSGLYNILVSGELPPGVDLARGGGVVAMGGVPAVEGTYAFTVSVADVGLGGTVSHTYSLHIGPRLLRPDLQTATVTDAEGFKFSDTDSVFFPAKIVDTEAFHFSDADSVFMPVAISDLEGFKFKDTESIFGPDKPSDAEAFHFGDTVVVLTSAMISDPETLHFTDTDTVVTKVGISPPTAPAGTYNVAYSQTFTAAGNTGTATFTPTGTLPTGLSFTTTTGQTKISGTPTATGTFPFTLKVVDSGAGGTSTIPYSLTINPASQTISVGTIPSVAYGAGNFSLTASASPSGLAVTIASTSALATGTNPFVPVAAGTATFQATQAGNANYTAATPVNFNVTIAQATLNVTASVASRVFDQPNPSFGYGLSNFVNGDNASVVSGTASITTAATPISPVSGSPYAITPNVGTLAAANYTFVFTNGSLAVTKAPQSITFYPLPNITHGTSFPLSARASSGLAVTYTVSGPASISNNILSVTGTGTVQVTAAQAGNGNYSAATSAVRSFTAQ
jgi:hypothetical protein